MKFPTLKELDDRRYRRISERGWHRWFAWRPITFDGNWHWLCYLERKMDYDGWGTFYKYRQPEKVQP